METRIALIGIIIEKSDNTPNPDAASQVNDLLHQYSSFIVGRMGIPYKEKDIAIISIIIDASADVISSLSGKLGMIKGISVKTMYSKNAN